MIVNGIEMERIDFDYDGDWTIVNLADGTILKMKPELNGVLRMVNTWDANSEPIYQLNTPVRCAFVSVPEELCKPKPEIVTTARTGPDVAKGKVQ